MIRGPFFAATSKERAFYTCRKKNLKFDLRATYISKKLTNFSPSYKTNAHSLYQS